MKSLILFAVFGCALAAPQRFAPQQLPPEQGGPQQFQGPPPREFINQQGPPQQGQPPQGAPQQGPPPPQPIINWGQCPQLEPTMQDKLKKSMVINKCLEVTQIPENITRETVEQHRENVAACALQYEGWFNEQGQYKFDKAENEIKLKKLTAEVEAKVLSYHKQCKDEAMEKFPANSKNIIAQIQLYQACMDYFISEVCGIEVTIPGQQPPPQHQQVPPQYQQQPPQQPQPPQYRQAQPSRFQ